MSKKKKNNNKVHLMLFWAGWCSGCTNMKPLFYDETKKFNIKYDLIDVEDESGVNLSIRYGVRNVPTILVFKGNELIGRECGNSSYQRIGKYVGKKNESTTKQ
jgi:thioredoxin 1